MHSRPFASWVLLLSPLLGARRSRAREAPSPPTAGAHATSAAPTVQLSAAAARVPTVAASAPAPTASPSAPSAGALPAAVPPCSASPRQAFHLRPEYTRDSVGPELPAGTALDVLYVGAALRGAKHLLEVRVRASGARGFTFVGTNELGPECPALWPGADENLVADPPSRSSTREEAIRLALERMPGAPGEGDPPPREARLRRVDLDGDGQRDELVRFELPRDMYPAATVAVFRAAAEYVVVPVGSDVTADHPNSGGASEIGEPIELGGGVYVQATSNSSGSNDDGTASTEELSYRLLRCRRLGPCVTVFTGTTLMGPSDPVRFSTEGPDLVRISTSNGRSQVLRWDAERFRLVP